MVDDEISDGERIGQLLSSEVHGHERGSLGRLSVVDADPDVEPNEAGAFAYAIELDYGSDDGVDYGSDDGVDYGSDDGVDYGSDDGGGSGDDDRDGDDGKLRLAEVYVHPGRAHVEFREGVDRAVETAENAGIRVRPKAVEPPRALVFVENGAEVKPALRVVRAVADGILEDGG